MDLRLYGRVIWRFRLIVLAGVLLAIGLTVLSAARVSLKNGRPSLSYRQQEIWESTAKIFVTQTGSPIVRSVAYSPDNFATYAALYADLATSDDVHRLMLKDGPVPGTVTAVPATNTTLGTPRPLVEVSGLATTPKDAIITARRGTRALIAYIKKQQDALRLPTNQRVLLKELNEPRAASVTAKRSKTRPIVVFVATMMAVLGLVFVLENLRPRLRSVEVEPATHRPAETTRRSA